MAATSPPTTTTILSVGQEQNTDNKPATGSMMSLSSGIIMKLGTTSIVLLICRRGTSCVHILIADFSLVECGRHLLPKVWGQTQHLNN